jgi:hypothetical protein
MAKFKKLDGYRVTVEIHRLEVVKEKCILEGMTLKDYINDLIYQDMLKSSEYLSIKYFKQKDKWEK